MEAETYKKIPWLYQKVRVEKPLTIETNKAMGKFKSKCRDLPKSRDGAAKLRTCRNHSIQEANSNESSHYKAHINGGLSSRSSIVDPRQTKLVASRSSTNKARCQETSNGEQTGSRIASRELISKRSHLWKFTPTTVRPSKVSAFDSPLQASLPAEQLANVSVVGFAILQNNSEIKLPTRAFDIIGKDYHFVVILPKQSIKREF
ncbi:hypothetical protein CCACVL1_07208 [Corchorus capsularis]|uniref:Uncharacterized protein n=1 Tax=Corchorus capsularis TaxID=210143 RepID=A0A1R3J8K3_COCAP|nr:hypothetical protein CCACVL1_07208 [Corchorus capsularis]